MDTGAVTPVSPFPTLGTTARRSGDVLPTLARCLAPLALVILATTWPWSCFQPHAHWASVEWVPFSKFVRPFDFLANVVLFTPFGVAFGWGGTTNRRILRAVVWGLVLSLAVEYGQVYTHNRVASVTDVLTNTLGAWLGARWAVQQQRLRADATATDRDQRAVGAL